jgi:hypothetical protein
MPVLCSSCAKFICRFSLAIFLLRSFLNLFSLLLVLINGTAIVNIKDREKPGKDGRDESFIGNYILLRCRFVSFTAGEIYKRMRRFAA